MLESTYCSDKKAISADCVVIDYENDRLVIEIKENLNTDEVWCGRLDRRHLGKYLNRELSSDRKKIFKSDLTYLTFKKIIKIMTDESARVGYTLCVSNNLRRFIDDREMLIYEKSRVALDIKRHDDKVLSEYNKYKSVVDARMVRPLREQQMWDSFFMYTLKKAANFSVPGSGKTASVLGVYAYLKSQNIVDKIVMIGPKNSFGSWKDEFEASFGDNEKTEAFNIQDFEGRDGKSYAINFGTVGKNLIMFNYEAIPAFTREIENVIDSRTLLVLDEVHKIKKIDGERATAVMRVAEKARHIIALTGTPIPNSYLDIYNILNILYKDEYDEFFGFSPSCLSNPTSYDIKEINRKIQPFYCRTTKEQLMVPRANKDKLLSVCANSVENELFKILLKLYHNNKLTLMIRLLQLETNPQLLLEKIDVDNDLKSFLDIFGDFEEIDFHDYSDEFRGLVTSIDKTTKYNKCLDLAADLYELGKSLIIWCVFVDSMCRLHQDLTARGIKAEIIYGGTSQEERNNILSQFKNGKIDVLITNPHTLAESVSLHKCCHDAIYFEYSYNLVHLLQSKDRINRLGLPENQYTQYYFMQQYYDYDFGSYSIDEQIYERLAYKERIMLDAIENQVLEQSTSTQEDLDLVFKSLKL